MNNVPTPFRCHCRWYKVIITLLLRRRSKLLPHGNLQPRPMDLGAYRQTGPTQITAVPVEVPPTFFAALGGTSVTGPQVSVHLISLAPRFYPGHPGYVPAEPTHLDAEVRAVSVSAFLDPGPLRPSNNSWTLRVPQGKHA